jgi:hypothetical protein
VEAYRLAKLATVAAGYGADIAWQESVSLDKVTAQSFLREHAFVVLNSGMRAAVVARRWPAFRAAFADFADLDRILECRGAVRTEALAAFSYPAKVDACLTAVERMRWDGIDHVLAEVRASGLVYLRTWPFIGPVTCYHLAKNLGLPVAKPDRHLVRLAAATGRESAQALCEEISSATGDSVPVVDVVLWRWAAITPGYLAQWPPAGGAP